MRLRKTGHDGDIWLGLSCNGTSPSGCHWNDDNTTPLEFNNFFVGMPVLVFRFHIVVTEKTIMSSDKVFPGVSWPDTTLKVYSFSPGALPKVGRFF